MCDIFNAGIYISFQVFHSHESMATFSSQCCNSFVDLPLVMIAIGRLKGVSCAVLRSRLIKVQTTTSNTFDS